MGVALTFEFVDGSTRKRQTIEIREAVIAGWTGRDKAAVQHHIHELEAIGVKPPSKTPLFYRVSADRLTTSPVIETLGTGSSGEVEFLLVRTGGRLWVGAGSDHTDRKVEGQSIALAKQLCDKPVAPVLYPFESVVDHWDELILRSWIYENGGRVLYQEGTTAGMLRPEFLMDDFAGGELADGTLMFGGTIPARGGIRPSPQFELELIDDRDGWSIKHAYQVRDLPVVE